MIFLIFPWFLLIHLFSEQCIAQKEPKEPIPQVIFMRIPQFEMLQMSLQMALKEDKPGKGVRHLVNLAKTRSEKALLNALGHHLTHFKKRNRVRVQFRRLNSKFMNLDASVKRITWERSDSNASEQSANGAEGDGAESSSESGASSASGEGNSKLRRMSSMLRKGVKSKMQKCAIALFGQRLLAQAFQMGQLWNREPRGAEKSAQQMAEKFVRDLQVRSKQHCAKHGAIAKAMQVIEQDEKLAKTINSVTIDWNVFARLLPIAREMRPSSWPNDWANSAKVAKNAKQQFLSLADVYEAHGQSQWKRLIAKFVEIAQTLSETIEEYKYENSIDENEELKRHEYLATLKRLQMYHKKRSDLVEYEKLVAKFEATEAQIKVFEQRVAMNMQKIRKIKALKEHVDQNSALGRSILMLARGEEREQNVQVINTEIDAIEAGLKELADEMEQ